MPRESWVYDRELGRLVPRAEFHERRFERIAHASSDLPSPMTISDHMDEMICPADGRRYASKRAYDRAVVRNGCQIVAGEDVFKHTPPKPEAKDPTPAVMRAWNKLQQGYRPDPEAGALLKFAKG